MSNRPLVYGGLAALAICTAGIVSGCGDSTAAASATETPTATATAGFYGTWTPGAPTPEPTPTATQPPEPTPTPTPVPTPTPDRTKELVLAYTGVVAKDSARLQRAMAQMGRYCGLDVSMCRLALEDAGSQAGAFLRDLDGTPAPPCLSAADDQIRQALRYYQDGARQGVQGIDFGDADLITAGGNAVNRGTDHMNQATRLIRNASC